MNIKYSGKCQQTSSFTDLLDTDVYHILRDCSSKKMFQDVVEAIRWDILDDEVNINYCSNFYLHPVITGAIQFQLIDTLRWLFLEKSTPVQFEEDSDALELFENYTFTSLAPKMCVEVLTKFNLPFNEEEVASNLLLILESSEASQIKSPTDYAPFNSAIEYHFAEFLYRALDTGWTFKNFQEYPEFLETAIDSSELQERLLATEILHSEIVEVSKQTKSRTLKLKL